MIPKIGMVMRRSQNASAFNIGDDYVHALIKQGGLPLAIPHCKPDFAKEFISGLDGLLIPGGGDIVSLLFGEETLQGVGGMSRDLDLFEFEMVKEAVAQKKPVYGICRGIQLINVALGGTIFQDIPSQLNTKLLHSQGGGNSDKDVTVHKVAAVKDSWTHKIFGSESFEVNSFHHQSVKDLGKGLKVTGTASDGVIEAIESDDGLVYGVQWHPERLYAALPMFEGFFKTLVDKARK